MKTTVEEGKTRVVNAMRPQNPCGPALMRVMWEAYGLKNEDFLWAGAAIREASPGNNRRPAGRL